MTQTCFWGPWQVLVVLGGFRLLGCEQALSYDRPLDPNLVIPLYANRLLDLNLDIHFSIRSSA